MVTYDMDIHQCFADHLHMEWASLQTMWSTRRLLEDILLIGVHEIDKLQDVLASRLLSDPVGTRLLQGQWWIDLDRAQRELSQTERQVMTAMRRFYVMLNLIVPVDITGY